MSELNDIKVDNEEFWWEALDDFASDDEITVVEISRDDLYNNSTDGLKALGQVDMGEWDDLAEILNEKEANLHKEDFEMEELLYLVLLYCDGRYVTSIQADADDDWEKDGAFEVVDNQDQEFLDKIINLIDPDPEVGLYIAQYILTNSDKVKAFLEKHDLDEALFFPIGTIFYLINLPDDSRKETQRFKDNKFLMIPPNN